MAAAEAYDWTRPYRTWEATLKKQDDEEDADAALKKREAAAAAACGGCRNLDRTEERALFAQPVADTLEGARLAVQRGERMFQEGRLERAVQWYEKALVAYDYAFPEDGETQRLLDAMRRDALLGSARVYLEAKLPRAALRSCREVVENDEARLLEARACRELDLFDEARTTLSGIDAPRERALLQARERAYATNSKVVSKRIFDRKPKLRKGILPSSIPACQRDELDDAAQPIKTAAEAFSSLVETLEGDDIKDRSRLMCT
jgi:tetratricopeptide (TPR) repeat protein